MISVKQIDVFRMPHWEYE